LENNDLLVGVLVFGFTMGLILDIPITAKLETLFFQFMTDIVNHTE
jgi:hypothetical protein